MSTEVLTEKRALSVAEASRYACVSRGIIELWMSKGLLPYEELPGTGKGSNRFLRIRLVDLDEFLNERYRQKKRQAQRQKVKSIILLPQDRVENEYGAS